jgi:hypothetical protein
MLTFETPSWVPPGVARLIEKLSEPDSTPVPVDPEVIRRLATDVRMRNVWAELTKKARDTDGTTGRAFHLGRLPDAVRSWGALAGAERAQSNRIGDLGDAEGAQAYKQLAEGMDFLDCMRAKPSIDSAQEHQLSLALLFLCTLSLYASNLTSVSKEEVEAWKQRELAAGNTSIAAAIDREVADPNVQRLIVARHRTEPRLEAFVEQMAIQLRQLFGNPLHGVLATVANVTFGRDDLTRERVRTILRRRTRKTLKPTLRIQFPAGHLGC